MNFTEFITANGPNVFKKRILKEMRKAYSSIFGVYKNNNTGVHIYHNAIYRPVGWYDHVNKCGYFP